MAHLYHLSTDQDHVDELGEFLTHRRAWALLVYASFGALTALVLALAARGA
jgi:hypothetical protein